MMGFSVNKYGKLNTHTDYFDYIDVEKSLELPFPDGNVKEFNNDDSGANVELINNYVDNLFNGTQTDKELLKLSFNETVDFLNKVSKMNIIPSKGLSDEAKEYVKGYFENQVTDPERLLEASKNVAMTSLYKASNAVVNLMAGHRGVDMNDPQAGASKSPKLWQSKQFSMDNYMTTPLMKEENAAGKDVIGISAVGMKVFYALTYFYNKKIREFEKRLENVDINDKESSEYLDLKFEFKNFMNPKNFVFYDEKTKTNKKYISTFLANINFDNCPKANELYSDVIEDLKYTIDEEAGEQVLNDFEIIDARNSKDTSLILSAMVSAATDNAKELILAKINAGPELAGTYIYMIMQGLSFDSITDFMVSPTLDAIVKVSKSNIFENKESTIDTSVNYFLKGVNVNNFLNQKQIDTINYYMMITNGKYDTVDKKTGESKNPFLELLTEEGKSEFIYTTEDKDGNTVFKMRQLGNNLQKYFYYLKEGGVQDFLKLMEEKKFLKNDKFKDEYQKVDFASLFSNDPYDFNDFISYEDDTERIGINIALNRFIKEVNKRNEILESLGTSSERFIDLNDPIHEKVERFAKIYEDAQECKAFGTRLGINGGMATDLYGQYRYYRGIAKFINKKITPEFGISFEEDHRSEMIQAGVKNIFDLTNLKTFHQTVFKNDLEKAQNELRRKLLIELYSKLQSKFNIVQAENDLPHFNAMMGVHNTTMDIFTGASLRYDYTLKLMEKLYEDELIPEYLNGNLHSYNEDEVNGISNFILTDLVMGYFKNKKYEITLPDGINYYNENFNLKTSQTNTIDLSTPHGKASFKLFVEEYLKSELQKENPNNEFLQNLIFEEGKDPLDGNTYSFMKMNMDMSSIKSDLDRFRFQNYLIGYSATKDMSTSDLGYPVKINGKPSKTSVGDLFMLYNLLINNNAFGKNTLTKILEADLSKKQDTLITEFFGYMGMVDSLKDDPTKNFYPIDLVDVNKLAILIAPKVTKNDLNKYISKYVKVYNPETKKFDLYQFEKSENKFQKGTYKIMSSEQIYEGIPSKLYFTDANISGTEANLLSLFNISDKLVEEFKNGNLNINIEC